MIDGDMSGESGEARDVSAAVRGTDRVAAAHGGNYGDKALRRWAERLQELAKGLNDVYVYFNNDWHADAVRDAFTLRAALGEPVRVPAELAGCLPPGWPTCQSKLEAKVQKIIDDLVAQDVNSPEFGQKVDQLTRAVQSETDKAKRMAMIKQAFDIHANDIGHLPLHQQSLAWGISKKVNLVQLADNFMPFKWITVKK